MTGRSEDSTLVEILAQPVEDFGVVLGNVAPLARIGLEIVELGYGIVAQLGVGRKVLLRAVRGRDELPLPPARGEPAGMLDQGLAADRILPEESGEVVAAVAARRDGLR